MPEPTPDYTRPPVRRRRKKTKMQIFKETYLPLVTLVGIILVVIGIIVGCVKLSNRAKERKAEQESSLAAQQEAERLAQEAAERGKKLLPQAEALAAQYDYDGAIALLSAFDGDPAQVPGMTEAIEKYRSEKNALVLWEDVGTIPHISFQALVAKPTLAFASGRGDRYRSNHVTVDEFSAILQALYENGYVLVNLSDVAPNVADGSTSHFEAGQIYLPLGKKPLVLSQLPVNYGFPAGHGFAARLTVGADGRPTAEYVNSAGESETGAYDLVPLLDQFIDAHPDFSYRGAKAILAFTGSEGVLGYQTQPSAKDTLGEDAYRQEVAAAQKVAQALIADGYTLACFSYDYVAYGNVTLGEIEDDLSSWAAEIEPIVGKTDVLFYYSGSDIAGTEEYSGSRYDALHDAGFRYFCTLDNEVPAWLQVTNEYVRQARRTVNGSRLTESPELVADLFDAAKVVSKDR